ncbi:LruC domain-containing protein [Mucilaginibacter pedocola]|uniref:DUF4842 domain-containing protein n=1 Tax=Mucilaginibacter pedocola TaxID=1792845 RepID=A0A1S9P6X8_9SPHI|nr:LruC domain-containing protein [Mucilaginibacter pedocola]OOQ56705.1 hypothetical protein BC343_17055 [Mucilaginibacter pedocola]
MSTKPLLTILIISACFFSCKKDTSFTAPSAPSVSITTPVDSTIAPENFSFSTTHQVTVDVQLLTNNSQPIKGVPVDIMASNTPGTDAIATVVSNESGQVHAVVNLPLHTDTLIIDAKYVGLMRNAKAVVTGDAVNGIIGGPGGHSGNIVESTYAVNTPASRFTLNSIGTMATNTSYLYMGAYDNSGVPKYLEPTRDAISADLLSYINASLPETKNVATLHPSYLESSATADLNITQTADVWITFVSEGAGYLNTLGYYTYPTGNAPQSPADIKTVYYMFPNASLSGSGGNLHSGDKVKLGRFDAGTSIGFVLLANAWNGGSKTVDAGAPKFYTTTACNPETNASLKKHTVLLYAESEKLYLIGIDDQNRQTGGSDNDFNDVLFYATSNPVTAISNTNVQPIDQPKDTDGDGVTDTFDQFPTDPTRAYVSYYPSKTTFGSLVFEDLWPATGDYDLNDLVVGYRYKTVTNAKNNVVEMYADYNVKAAGASFINGFGVQFPFSPAAVKSVSGQKMIGNYIQQSGNGTESNQSKAVIIPFDNYQAIIKRPGGYYINTQNEAPVIKGDTVHIYMSFNSPISASTLGTAPFNPFLISNQRRGYEVHLPDNAPTDLADKKLFSTLQDNTNTGLNRTYKSKNAWPYALNFSEQFDYPVEGSAINKSYNYFLQWAKSGGSLHKDWYLDVPGNRNSSLIYKK